MKRFKITKEELDSDLCREIKQSHKKEDIILYIEYDGNYDSDFVEISSFSIKFKTSFLNPEKQAPSFKIDDEDYYFKGEDEFTKLVWIDEKWNETWETKLEIDFVSFKIISIRKDFNNVRVEIYLNKKDR